jgi:hypothetical protein
MKIIDNGPPLMARDCGCGTCQAILEDAARRKAASTDMPYVDQVRGVTIEVGE